MQPALRNPAVVIATGQRRYRESVAGREFWVASPSFFQVNVKQAARLAELVRDGLRLSGRETVVDAYAGVGTFAALLAADAGEIIAIEEATAAIADAEENAAGLGNVRFLTGKVEDVLPGLAARPDAVILDPSRSGCQPAALAALLRLAPGADCLCVVQPGDAGAGSGGFVSGLCGGVGAAGGYVSADASH